MILGTKRGIADGILGSEINRLARLIAEGSAVDPSVVDALAELFSGARVVSNMVGPFIRYGHTVAEAALAAGCHYLDLDRRPKHSQWLRPFPLSTHTLVGLRQTPLL